MDCRFYPETELRLELWRRPNCYWNFLQNCQREVDLVKRVVCEYFQISEKDLINSRREQKIVRPRQLAMYLCKEMIPGIRYAEIGEQFGKRDHTTVMHACQKVETNLDDEFYKTSLDNIRERLK